MKPLIINTSHEEWRPVPGFEGLYEVSNQGRVKRLARTSNWKGKERNVREKMLAIRTSYNGHPCVSIYKYPRSTGSTVAHLVAQAFLPNPDNLSRVTHLNGDIKDNRVENLAWVKSIHPSTHSMRPIIQYSKDNNRIAEYASIAEASTTTGIDNGNIVHCLRGKRASAGGFYWKYADDEKSVFETGAVVCKICKRIWPKRCKWHSQTGLSL